MRPTINSIEKIADEQFWIILSREISVWVTHEPENVFDVAQYNHHYKMSLECSWNIGKNQAVAIFLAQRFQEEDNDSNRARRFKKSSKSITVVNKATIHMIASKRHVSAHVTKVIKIPANKIYLDTGCARTVVHWRIVPSESVKKTKIAMWNVNRQSTQYPLADVTIQIDDAA